MTIALPDVTPITVADITTGSVSGNGIFDVLMKTVSAHLLSEYQADRITKSDYGQVYVSALTSTLQQAIQFELNKDQAAIQAATLAAQYELIAHQKEALILQNELLTYQKEALILQNQKITSDIAVNNAQIALINQKKTTEIAQTTNGYAGVVGAQIDLYNAQITGFTRDAEQKAAKLALDVLATQISVDDSATVENTNMHNSAIGAFVSKLAEGINVTIPSS